jgi:hypothetical protein
MFNLSEKQIYLCLKKLNVMINIKFSPIILQYSWISNIILGNRRARKNNKAAVMALPKPLQVFFYNHIDFITQESTVPDLRKSVLKDKAENPRHYFDMENLEV